jgi:hypothetical protein
MSSTTLETSVRLRQLIIFPAPNSADDPSFGARAGAEPEVLVLPVVQLGAGLAQRCNPTVGLWVLSERVCTDTVTRSR